VTLRANSNKVMEVRLSSATPASRVLTNGPRARASLTSASTVAGAVEIEIVANRIARGHDAPPAQ